MKNATSAWQHDHRVPFCPSCYGSERQRARAHLQTLRQRQGWTPEQRRTLERLKHALIGNSTAYPRTMWDTHDANATCTWDCYRRATMLEPLAWDILEKNVPGDFLEAGVYRGGISIFLASMLLTFSTNEQQKVIAFPSEEQLQWQQRLQRQPRTMWIADSFQGLPEQYSYTRNWVDTRSTAGTADTYGLVDDEGRAGSVLQLIARDRDGHGFSKSMFSTPIEQVRRSVRRHLGKHDTSNIVRFLPGFFASTLPGPVERLALLRVDADLWASTREVLDALYPRLSKGGYIVFDDWKIAQVRLAVLQYREEHNITDQIYSSNKFDWGPTDAFFTLDRIAFWQKA